MNVFEQYVLSFPNTLFCLYGHSHNISVKDLFGAGLLYYECPNIAKRIYLLFTINENDYTYEAVEY